MDKCNAQKNCRALTEYALLGTLYGSSLFTPNKPTQQIQARSEGKTNYFLLSFLNNNFVLNRVPFKPKNIL